MHQISLAIYESKKSEKAVKFINATSEFDFIEQLNVYCSNKYSKRIYKAMANNLLNGIHFTYKGKIRATFI